MEEVWIEVGGRTGKKKGGRDLKGSKRKGLPLENLSGGF